MAMVFHRTHGTRIRAGSWESTFITAGAVLLMLIVILILFLGVYVKPAG